MIGRIVGILRRIINMGRGLGRRFGIEIRITYSGYWCHVGYGGGLKRSEVRGGLTARFIFPLLDQMLLEKLSYSWGICRASFGYHYSKDVEIKATNEPPLIMTKS